MASERRVSAQHLAMITRERNTLVTEAVVENDEAGLLYVEGRLSERLAAGRHAFWTAGRKVEVKRLDLRPLAVEITAQEMLTKDRIALRVTLTAFRCESACKKDPLSGVIGIQSGPRDRGSTLASMILGSRGWDAGRGDDCEDSPRVF